MKNLLYLLPLLAAGCGALAESAPVVVEPKAPAFTAPEAPTAQPACPCDPNLKAEVAAEIQTLTNRVAKLESFHAAAEPKYTKPASPPKPVPVKEAQGSGMTCGPGGCGPARSIGRGLFFRRR